MQRVWGLMPDACPAPTPGPAPAPFSCHRLTFAGKTAERLQPLAITALQTLDLLSADHPPAHLWLHRPSPSSLAEPDAATQASRHLIPRPAPPSPARTCSDSCANPHPGSTRARQQARTRVHTPAHLCPRTHSPNRNVAPLAFSLTPDRGPVPGKLQLFRQVIVQLK